MKDPLEGLNDAQREAVTHDASPLAVLAGPGTGKTRVITCRVAHMIEARGVEPERIVALTFTNKAGEELRDRLGELLSRSVAERVHCFTFHAFGRRLLRRFADIARMPLEPHLMDSAQERRLLTDLVEREGHFRAYAGEGVEAAIERTRRVMRDLDHRAIAPEEALARAESRIKEIGEDPERADERAELRRFVEAARLASAFARERGARGWVEYSDMILRPIQLLRESEIVRDMCRGDYRHFVVDEFQDVDRAQIELLKALAPPESNPDLCVVGDDDQSIYAFRGADELAFERFGGAWANGRTIALRESYRSERPVLAAAQAIIENAASRFAPEKVVERAEALKDVPEAAGAGVEVVRLDDWREDGEVIAAMIRAEVARNGDREYRDFAVIARNHGDLGRIHQALEVEGVPARIARPPSPFEDEGVKDVMAWVELTLDPGATWAAARLLRRPPLSVDATRLGELERTYRGQRSRAEAGQEGVEDPGPYPAWLASAGASDATLAPTMERLASMHAAFVDLAGRAPADETLGEIIRQTGVAHAELLDSRERTRRVVALVSVIRFARQRHARLDPPGDLRSFWRYLGELDPKERERAAGDPGETLEPEAAEDGGEDVVTLLTAHASKGLEFDTVLLPRVTPLGYPTKEHDEGEALPACVVEDEAREGARRDEERRVFYVACTRAKRRLVLLAKLPKGKSSATHYTLELLDKGLASDRDAGDVRREAHEAGVAGTQSDALRREAAAYAAHRGASVVLADARREVRLDAAGALELAGLGGDVVKSGQTLELAAWRMALIAHVERTGQTPTWAKEHGLADEAQRLCAPGEAATSGVIAFPPMKAPLRLSYTSVKEYNDCPRCFYVRRVLELEESKGAPQRVGEVVHKALEKHVGEMAAAEAEGREGPGVEALLSCARELFFRATPPGEEVDRRLLAQVEAQTKAAADMLEHDKAHVLEVERVVRFPFEHDGQTHEFTAKLDRVDQLSDEGGRTSLRIVDYKTGQESKALLEPSSDDLQMCVYAMALRHEYDEDVRGVAEYWVLRTGRRGRIDLASLDLDKARKKIVKAVEGMLAGRFERGASGCRGLCSVLGDGGG
ncbi:MAG: ATP-dependent DNA helicase [Phycisphaerales bacterium]